MLSLMRKNTFVVLNAVLLPVYLFSSLRPRRDRLTVLAAVSRGFPLRAASNSPKP